MSNLSEDRIEISFEAEVIFLDEAVLNIDFLNFWEEHKVGHGHVTSHLEVQLESSNFSSIDGSIGYHEGKHRFDIVKVSHNDTSSLIEVDRSSSGVWSKSKGQRNVGIITVCLSDHWESFVEGSRNITVVKGEWEEITIIGSGKEGVEHVFMDKELLTEGVVESFWPSSSSFNCWEIIFVLWSTLWIMECTIKVDLNKVS